MVPIPGNSWTERLAMRILELVARTFLWLVGARYSEITRSAKRTICFLASTGDLGIIRATT
jgi:hypothetical protein